MTTKLNWWWVGGLAVVLSLIGVVALAAGRSGNTTPGAGSGSGSGSTAGGSSGNGSGSGSGGSEPPIEPACLILADGTTVQIGQTLYSSGYTPMVLNPDSKAPIIESRYTGEAVGTFTGRSFYNPNYFSTGNCFIQVAPAGKGANATTLPLTLWIHPKHVTAKQPS
ncbi:hypothetical protein ACAW74_18180 [Fibrella sp. WM1]|uniref:hypothetical protein n=1 Tax=Fibrella musci TaxID=3242485 RepID=UPI0035203E48